MPQKVYNNVEGHRVIDNGRVAEDVTSITLPDIKHPTTSIASSGMAMDVDMPNTTHLDAMSFSIAHNNGVYCKNLADPGKHFIELRVARQRYNVAAGEIEHESVKFRITGVHVEVNKGSIETGNPFGSTDKYSILRYEEEVNGEVTTIIDAMAGVIKINGKDCTNVIENLLN
ncbi:MAG: phage major tail tube protein [Eubacteriales bacterium]|nr:phage major tail tube protein [Eubacteriales bacterium]MDD4512863.1 phage major tail tube protein [Eubacteriales bacterium]